MQWNWKMRICLLFFLAEIANIGEKYANGTSSNNNTYAGLFKTTNDS